MVRFQMNSGVIWFWREYRFEYRFDLNQLQKLHVFWTLQATITGKNQSISVVDGTTVLYELILTFKVVLQYKLQHKCVQKKCSKQAFLHGLFSVPMIVTNIALFIC